MVRATLGALAIGAALVLVPLMSSPAGAVEAGDLTLAVTAEAAGNAPPYAREMVLLHLRGTYRLPILREEVRQPPLTNFSWTQLGRDTWRRVQMADGQTALEFERTIAVFPQHTGTFTIDPFTHVLTVDDHGQRAVIDVHSAPVPIPVATWPDRTGGPDAAEPWWLPARDVAITDTWDPDPETVELGQSARRIVTLEAQGTLAEGLPPRPVMRSRGLVTFAGPVKRETIITPQGPVARATYQWDIRKGVPEVIPIEAIRIPWFDTGARVMREAEIPARQIGGGRPDREEDLGPPTPATWLTLASAGLVAFGLGLALLGFGGGRGGRLPPGDRLRLRRAARLGDALAFRGVLEQVCRAHPSLAAGWRTDPGTAGPLAALDRHVYGRGAADAPDLVALARRLSATRLRDAGAVEPVGRLPPLDGPLT